MLCRSSLKLIVERDDTACKRLVLCVSDIKPSSDTGQVCMAGYGGLLCSVIMLVYLFVDTLLRNGLLS